MSRIRQFGQRASTLEEMSKALSLLSHEIDKQLSNGLTFSNNMDMVAFTVADSGAAGTAIQIDHGLGRTPLSYIITFKDGPGDIYNSGTLGTASGAVIYSSGTNLKIKGFFF